MLMKDQENNFQKVRKQIVPAAQKTGSLPSERRDLKCIRQICRRGIVSAGGLLGRTGSASEAVGCYISLSSLQLENNNSGTHEVIS
jgi:hypothetical protein